MVAFALALTHCASVELRTDAGDRYLQTWVVDAAVDETTDAVVAAVTSQFGTLTRSLGAAGGRNESARYARSSWSVVRADPSGTVWLKHRKRGGFPHDVVVRIYPAAEGGSIVHAQSRSRMRFFDYRNNKRILSSLTASLEAHWSHHGMKARPSLGDHVLLP